MKTLFTIFTENFKTWNKNIIIKLIEIIKWTGLVDLHGYMKEIMEGYKLIY